MCDVRQLFERNDFPLCVDCTEALILFQISLQPERVLNTKASKQTQSKRHNWPKEQKYWNKMWHTCIIHSLTTSRTSVIPLTRICDVTLTQHGAEVTISHSVRYGFASASSAEHNTRASCELTKPRKKKKKNTTVPPWKFCQTRGHTDYQNIVLQ